MIDMEPNTAQWMSAWASVGTGVLAASALVFAGIQVRQSKASRKLTQQLDEESGQPNVVMYMEQSAATPVIQDLVIRNFGRTPGRNIRVSIDPWPTRQPTGGAETHTRVEIPAVIPFLAPGQEWRTMWDSGRRLDRDDLPRRHEGSLTYQGATDDERTSSFVLDWDTQAPRMWTDTKSVHDVAKTLDKIATHAGRWTEGFDGLKVYVRDGALRDESHRRWAHRNMLEMGERVGRRPAAKSRRRGV